MSSYYFDTNALYKYYAKTTQGSLTLRRLVSDDRAKVLISALTRIEFVNVLMKEYRRGDLRQSYAVRIIDRLTRDTDTAVRIGHRPFTLVPIPEETIKRAENLLLSYAKIDITVIDALHIAIAEKLRPTYPDISLVTADNGMQAVCKAINLSMFNPETIEA